MHTSAIGDQDIIENSTFQYYNIDEDVEGVTVVIPEATYDEGVGLLSWTVSYSDQLSVLLHKVNDLNYGNYISATSHEPNLIYLSLRNSYTVPIVGDETNINTGVPVRLDYDSNYHIDTYNDGDTEDIYLVAHALSMKF